MMLSAEVAFVLIRLNPCEDARPKRTGRVARCHFMRDVVYRAIYLFIERRHSRDPEAFASPGASLPRRAT